MSYKLKFIPSSIKEWEKLDNSTKHIFKKALAKRLVNPFVLSAKLSGLPIDCYKIKLKNHGYRLVYTVEQNYLIVLIVNRRDIVYKKLNKLIH